MVNHTSEVRFALVTLKQVHVKSSGPDVVHVARSSVYMFHHTKTAQVTNRLLARLNSKIVYLSMLSLLALLCVTVSFLSQ